MFQTPTVTLFAGCQLSCRWMLPQPLPTLATFMVSTDWCLPSRFPARCSPTSYSPTERNLMRFSRLTKWASEQSVSLNPSSFIIFAQKLCSFRCNVVDLCHAVATFAVLLQQAHPVLLRSVTVHKELSKVALSSLLWISVPNWASVFVVLVASIRRIVHPGLICRPGDADITIMCLCCTRILYILRVLVLGLSCTAAWTSLSARRLFFHFLHSLVRSSQSPSELCVVSNAVGCDVYRCWCLGQQHCYC